MTGEESHKTIPIEKDWVIKERRTVLRRTMQPPENVERGKGVGIGTQHVPEQAYVDKRALRSRHLEKKRKQNGFSTL